LKKYSKQSAGFSFSLAFSFSVGSQMWCYRKLTHGQRVIALALKDTMREQGAGRLVWLNIRAAFKRLQNKK
jgi:hypothetical protein